MDLDSQEAKGGKTIGQKVSQRLSGEAHLAGLETDGLPHLPARIPKQCMEKTTAEHRKITRGFFPSPKTRWELQQSGCMQAHYCCCFIPQLTHT